ncbi:MAG TPA: DUF664 domain-containing protein [Acidimicrobiales bacterium]|nr:DUF664 domain-containing protein [Acidimicrobiales bacterium]
MPDTDTPWEPPVAGSEIDALVGALERQRTTFRFKADGLDAAGLRTSVGKSSLTLGSLMKHLAACEDYKFTVRLTGAPLGDPWESWGWDGSTDWELESAGDDSPEELYAIYDDAVERSRSRLGSFLRTAGPDDAVNMAWPDGTKANLRRLLCDLLEEYARHTGHADLIREAVDRTVGEDPPDGWTPVSGSFRLPNT